MNKNQALVEKKNNIFTKILNKIKFLFNKNKYETVDVQKIQKERSNTNFIDSLKSSNEYNELIKLQHKIEDGTIGIADISEEEAEKLIYLYKSQMPELKIL